MTAKGAGKGDVRKRERNRLDKAGGGRRPELNKTLEIEREKRKRKFWQQAAKESFFCLLLLGRKRFCLMGRL
jgi:hypothetical protein